MTIQEMVPVHYMVNEITKSSVPAIWQNLTRPLPIRSFSDTPFHVNSCHGRLETEAVSMRFIDANLKIIFFDIKKLWFHCVVTKKTTMQISRPLIIKFFQNLKKIVLLLSSNAFSEGSEVNHLFAK